jgi:hypothetical protein
MISSIENPRICRKALSGMSFASLISETIVHQSPSREIILLFFTQPMGFSFISIKKDLYR